MTDAQYAGLFFIAIGLFSVAGAYFDWGWYMNSWRARIVVRTLGRGGARIFYGLFGIALSGYGMVTLLG